MEILKWVCIRQPPSLPEYKYKQCTDKKRETNSENCDNLKYERKPSNTPVPTNGLIKKKRLANFKVKKNIKKGV